MSLIRNQRAPRPGVTVYVILVVWICGAAMAIAGSATNALTLNQALRLADDRNIALQRVRQEAVIADAQITQARAAALPRVDLSAQYTRLDDVITFGEFTMGQRDNYEAIAEASQLLYAGGGVRAAVKLARQYSTSVAARIAYARDTTAYEAHAHFNQVLLAEENVKAAEQAGVLAVKNLGDVLAQLKQGLATRFDQLRAEEQVSRSESDRIAAGNALLKARFALLRFLELPLDDAVAIAGSLELAHTPPDTTNATALALGHRSDLAAAQRAVTAQREAVSVMQSGNRPTIAAFGQVKQANPDRSFEDEWEGSWLVGIRADVPLFDGMKTRGKVAQARASLRQAELQRDDLASRIRMEVARARADVTTAARLVDAREKSVTQAREALRLAQHAYTEGVQQQIDVITAQLAFTDSRRNHAAARFEHTMACRRLQLVMGTIRSRDNG